MCTDTIAPTLNMLENEMRDKVAEGHEGKRKVESLWPVHQINWQRSRYVYDMFYKYKKIDRETYRRCIPAGNEQPACLGDNKCNTQYTGKFCSICAAKLGAMANCAPAANWAGLNDVNWHHHRRHQLV